MKWRQIYADRMDQYIDELVGGWVPMQAPAEPAPTEPAPALAEPAWTYLIDAPDTGSVRYCNGYLSQDEQSRLFDHCLALPDWEYDKPLGNGIWRQRRGICMQAAPGVGGYRYSGQVVRAAPLDPVLGALLERVNAEQGTDYNSWLLNQYRPKGCRGSEGDYIGPHSDDETELGRTSDGKSVVFGLTLTSCPETRRPLVFKRKEGGARAQLLTEGGQAYVMEGALQEHWTHELPKRLRVPGTRISLTARRFKTGP